MTRARLSLLAAAVLLPVGGCEQHSASQTVPGFDEKLSGKQAVQEKNAATPLTISQTPPKFFPPRENQ